MGHRRIFRVKLALGALALALTCPLAASAAVAKGKAPAARSADAKDANKGSSGDASAGQGPQASAKDGAKATGDQVAPPPQACSGQPPQQATGAKKAVVPSEPGKAAGLEVYGRTPEEQAELKDFTQTIQSYEEQSKEYRKEIQLLVEKKYKDKRDVLSASYEKAIRDLEVVERQERLDAIAQFEEFLSRYPSEARYTPDVMYRLAELYYEKSEDDFNQAEVQYEAALKMVEAGKLAQAPPEPQIHFDKPVALYHQLLDEFPDYRFNDGTYYLLGYSLEKQGDYDASQTAYHTLIAKYPGSRFVPEAWMRMGEYYFDQTSDESIHKAIDAYTHAIAFKDHPLFDKALYKLGWSYYRVDDFDHAVGSFLTLLDFYQAKMANSGQGEDLGGDLRTEAMQYTAISFADDKWGSVDKAKAWFAQHGKKAYEAEIFRRIGDVFFDETKQADAVTSYRMFLALDPLNKNAPQVQDKIVQAYERDRDFDHAFAEREALVRTYGPKGAWAEANQHDPDVLKAAQDLSERSLYTSAIFHHKQALAYKSDGKADLAFHEFQIAAKGYSAYLERFPHSKEAYELTYYDAECLFYSLEFESAARQYIAVRDSNADNKYTQDAAESAVISLQHEIEAEQKAGKLATRPVILSAQRKEGEKIEPEPLPPLVKAFVDAVDAYVKRFPTCERAPVFAYKAGELYYTYNELPEARRRFEQVVKGYPDNAVAKYATNLIVETYLTSKDWKNVEDTAGALAQNACKADPKGETCVGLTKFKLAGRFKLADQLMGEGKYDAASAKYIQLVDEVQAQAQAGNEGSIREAKNFADKALNNAAVCLEKAHRFDSALKIYERLYTQYPQSPLADDALFRVAYDAQQSYDFDTAIERYAKLVKDYPTSKNRAAALANEAQLLEGDQRYQQAAKAFRSYAETFPDQEDAPQFEYHAAVIYERMKDYKGEIAALQDFQKKFARDAKQTELVVEASKKIGDAYAILHNDRAARSAYEGCVAEYKRRGMGSEKAVASNAAAEAAFKLAEDEFAAFDRLKITGRGKALAKSVKAKLAALKKAAESYNLVIPYKRVEWTLAAFYRKGALLEHLATSFTEAPIPPDVKRLGDEAVAMYQDQLGQQAAQFEDKAVQAYAATLAEAKKAHVLSNVWIQRTLESLNRYSPKEYPLLKEPKSALAFDTLHPPRLADTPQGPSVLAGASEPAPVAKPNVSPASAPAPKLPGAEAPAAGGKVSGDEK